MGAANNPSRRHNIRFSAMLAASVLCITACGSGPDATRATPSPVRESTATAAVGTATVAPAPAASPTAAPVAGPVGYPLDPAQRTDAVVGAPGARTIAAGQGPAVGAYSIGDQVSPDPVRANASGWNCRVHVEYEGVPAVDWYVPAGTPVRATMAGEAALYVNTVTNAFDAYGVSREPYIGNPDRARAPIWPFPGNGGGMGAYVSVTGEGYRTDYGHLDLAPTLAALGGSLTFAPPYGPAFGYAQAFATLRPAGVADLIATFRVKRGDLIGYTGDSGYSEAPHLHYVIVRLRDGAQLCPTSEAGFADNGWLER